MRWLGVQRERGVLVRKTRHALPEREEVGGWGKGVLVSAEWNVNVFSQMTNCPSCIVS
jgi:hypothetical protein